MATGRNYSLRKQPLVEAKLRETLLEFLSTAFRFGPKDPKLRNQIVFRTGEIIAAIFNRFAELKT